MVVWIRVVAGEAIAKWSDSRHVWRVEPARFADGWRVGVRESGEPGMSLRCLA